MKRIKNKNKTDITVFFLIGKQEQGINWQSLLKGAQSKYRRCIQHGKPKMTKKKKLLGSKISHVSQLLLVSIPWSVGPHNWVSPPLLDVFTYLEFVWWNPAHWINCSRWLIQLNCCVIESFDTTSYASGSFNTTN